MKVRTVAGRQLKETLQNQLIPWAQSGSPLVYLGTPPLVLGPNQVRQDPGPALPPVRGRGTAVREQFWRDQNLNALSVPYMGCVVEGEADLVVGTTVPICRKLKIDGARWVVQMPQKSFFILPPGVPISSGQRAHWHRPNPEQAYSRIFWMHVLETGVNCHFSTSSNGGLVSHPYTFVTGNAAYPLAQAMLHELDAQSAQYMPIAYHLLSLFLRFMQRSLETSHLSQRDETAYSLFRQAASDAVVQRALRIIDADFTLRSLTVEQLAARLNISTVHLNRLFRRELDSTVIAYITKRRMELASRLLIQSAFTIEQVRMKCGYATSSSFIKAFIRHYGVTPTQYRLKHRA
jgi:AraC-like DNA-binding protein